MAEVADQNAFDEAVQAAESARHALNAAATATSQPAQVGAARSAVRSLRDSVRATQLVLQDVTGANDSDAGGEEE